MTRNGTRLAVVLDRFAEESKHGIRLVQKEKCQLAAGAVVAASAFSTSRSNVAGSSMAIWLSILRFSRMPAGPARS